MPTTFRTVQGERKSLYICNAARDTLFVNDGLTLEIKHVFAGSNTYNALDTWKLQKVDAALLESPSAQLRLSLARKLSELGSWGDGIYIIDNIISYDPIGGVEKLSYEVVNDKVTSDHMPIKAELRIGFDDDGTGIGELDKSKFVKSSNCQIYDLTSRRVSAEAHSSLPKGIYIVGGKKMKK